jgi:pilus assembly protein CpaD
MRPVIRILATVALLATLASCEWEPAQFVNDARLDGDSFRSGNRVDLVQYNHMVKFSCPGARAPKRELARLDAFFNGIQLKYGDEISLRGGTKARRRFLTTYIRRTGLPITVRSEPDNPKRKKTRSVALLVERYVVTPPACPNWSNFHGNNQRNTPGSQYGCSTDAALGYMIANPKDLAIGQVMKPGNIDAALGAQSRYRGGQVRTPQSLSTGG